MKKEYTTPALIAARIQCVNMIAASIPVGGETDDEARSNKFWGKTIFDDTEEEDIDEGSIF